MSKVNSYTDEQRRTIRDCGQAARLLGQSQTDAAKAAQDILGVPVSAASVSRCMNYVEDVFDDTEEPDTLFDTITENTAMAIMDRLDAILSELKSINLNTR